MSGEDGNNTMFNNCTIINTRIRMKNKYDQMHKQNNVFKEVNHREKTVYLEFFILLHVQPRVQLFEARLS